MTEQSTEYAARRERTRELILAVQIATEKSRKRYPYARAAWAALGDAGQIAAQVARAEAIGEVIELNRGLMVAMARRWRGVCDDLISPEDVFAAAQEGYINSLIMFDLGRDLEHSTYATKAMVYTIVRMVDSLQPFGQSVSVTRAVQKVRKALAAHLSAYGRPSSLEELVAETGLDTDVVQVVLKMPMLISGDGYDGDSEDGVLDETAAPENTETQSEIDTAVMRADAAFGPAWRDMVGTPMGDELIRSTIGATEG